MVRALNIVGARPNLMKMAPVIAEMRLRPNRFEALLVHTGQHYDEAMSGAFFNELGIPAPDINLGVGSGSHAEQTGRIMIGLDEVITRVKPDWVVVAGDVNSTMAAALVAVKQRIPVAHVEAGLRSRDRAMPEEINRIVTDAVADLLLTPSREADQNLINEGVDPVKIRFVGNVMIDTLHRNLDRAGDSKILEKLALHAGGYCAMTLHRPSNVDDKETLAGILDAISAIQQRTTVVFSVHPRTRKRIDEFGLTEMLRRMENLILTEPLGYLDFLQLYRNSKFVLTDSGGIQEETTALGIPCITLRGNTERPITITEGTNRLAGSDPEIIKREAFRVLDGAASAGRVPELWDGHAAVRIVDAIEQA